MACDRLRPGRGDGIVPIVYTFAVIRLAGVAHWQFELCDARLVVGQHVGTDRPPQFREIGLRGALARDQNEIGGVDRADRGKRELRGITTADAYQGERQHAFSEGRPQTTAPHVVAMQRCAGAG